MTLLIVGFIAGCVCTIGALVIHAAIARARDRTRLPQPLELAAPAASGTKRGGAMAAALAAAVAAGYGAGYNKVNIFAEGAAPTESSAWACAPDEASGEVVCRPKVEAAVNPMTLAQLKARGIGGWTCEKITLADGRLNELCTPIGDPPPVLAWSCDAGLCVPVDEVIAVDGGMP